MKPQKLTRARIDGALRRMTVSGDECLWGNRMYIVLHVPHMDPDECPDYYDFETLPVWRQFWPVIRYTKSVEWYWSRDHTQTFLRLGFRTWHGPFRSAIISLLMRAIRGARAHGMDVRVMWSVRIQREPEPEDDDIQLGPRYCPLETCHYRGRLSASHVQHGSTLETADMYDEGKRRWAWQLGYDEAMVGNDKARERKELLAMWAQHQAEVR